MLNDCEGAASSRQKDSVTMCRVYLSVSAPGCSVNSVDLYRTHRSVVVRGSFKSQERQCVHVPCLSEFQDPVLMLIHCEGQL